MNAWEIGGTQNRWVCPSDRHLQLRAQLKSGWSVRTATLRSPKSDKKQCGITESEQEHIRAVLARVDASKMQEQLRIGKMMDCLDKMRTRSTGNGITQCLMCSTDFGLLSSKSYGAMCFQCRKYVCKRTCGIETCDSRQQGSVFLCKLCSELREMWKKSGAWFYKEMPEYAKPTESTETQSPPSCTKNWQNNAKYISTNSYVKMRNGNEQPTNSTDQCSHNSMQRPIITPSWVNEKVQSSLSVCTDDENESISDEGESGAKLVCTSNSKPKFSSKLQQLHNKHRTPTLMERFSIGRSQIMDTDESGESRPSTPSISPHHSHSSYGDDLSQNPSSIITSDAKSVDSGVMQSENSVPLCEKATGNQERLSILRNESHLNSKLAAVDLGADDPLSPVESGSSSAECGIKKISYSILYRDKASQGEYAFDSKPITITESPVKCLSIPARLRSPLPLCASSPQPISIECRDSGATPGNLHDQTNRPTFANISSEDESTLLGSIEFELFYCPSAKQLKIYLLRAKNLISMDKNGFSDPYVKLHLIPGPSKATKLTSRTIEKTLNPEWNEVFTYHGICEDDKFKKSLRIIVMDRDRIKSDFLGETRVMLKKLPNNTRKHFNLYLERAMPVPTDKGKANRERGKLLVAIVYNVQQGSLFVTIKRCAELLGMDPTGFSDPYVKVMLTPLSNKSHRQRTSIKKRTLNPEFNETFAFMVPFKDLPMKTLQIGVYDHDIAKHDDYIGSVILSVSAKGDRQKQWIDCMQNPGDVCEYWHRIELE